LIKCDYDSLDDINYSLITNKRTQEENKNKLIEFVRLNDIYSVKSLPQIFVKVKEMLENRLVHVKKDINENREFIDEFKKNKPVDITKVYDSFVNRKRGRS
jgi:hypothetical protein